MDRLEQWVTAVTDAASHPVAFVLAALTVFGWAVSGPFLGFSEVWQLTINTGTTIITFLVGFSILVSTKRDSLALHGKLDHLIRNQSGPNHFVREDEKTTRQIESDRERHDG